MLSSTVYQGGHLVDKNGYFICTKMPICNNFGNSSQSLKIDAGQNSTIGYQPIFTAFKKQKKWVHKNAC